MMKTNYFPGSLWFSLAFNNAVMNKSMQCKIGGFQGGVRRVVRSLVTADIVPSSQILLTFMMKAIRSSETSVLTSATRRNIHEDGIFQRLYRIRHRMIKEYGGLVDLELARESQTLGGNLSSATLSAAHLERSTNESQPLSNLTDVCFSVKLHLIIRFEVFETITMKNSIFWDITTCDSFKNRLFG
jgi:hypothetical protein